MSSKSLKRICITLFVAAWANAMVFGLVAKRVGGEAFHGKIENGRYYLALDYLDKHHTGDFGHFTEVSAAVFHYSQVHSYSVLVTFPLGLLAGFAGFLLERKQKRV